MEEQKVSPEYLRAFNQGYQLQKHEPDIANIFGDALKEKHPDNGLQQGREEYLNEQFKAKTLVPLQGKNDLNLANYDGFEKENNQDIEPEK